MAPLVMLRSPSGVTKAVDPDSFDVASAMRDGFTRVPEGPTRPVTADTGRSLSNREVTGDIVRRGVREVLPSALAMGASFAAPEVMAPLGLAGRFVPWMARTAAAGIGGTAGALGAQGVTGQRLDPMAALSRGVGEMTAQGVGEGLVGGAQGLATGLYKGALRPGMKLSEQAAETASRLAGKTVAVDEASLARQGLKERIPLGRGFTGTGTEKLTGMVAPEIADKTAAIKAANRARWKFNPQNLASAITDLKAEVRGEVGGMDKIADIDQLWKDELSKWQNTTFPSGRPRPGAPKIDRMSAADLDEAVMKWQQQADYNRAAEDPKEALRGRVAKALAREGRANLRAIQAPFRPGMTAGEAIARANDRMSELHPIQDAVSTAETRMEAGTGGSAFPWYMHAGAPVVGAGLGAASGGPTAGAGGALLGLAADRALSNPAVASRLALALSHPGVKATLKQVPRAGMDLMNLLSQPARRDAVAQ